MVEEEINIEGIVLLNPTIYSDNRGFFQETFNHDRFKAESGENFSFVQDNLSCSHKHVLRGLHFQAPPYAQGKLIQVIKGSVIDIAVDLRKLSKTFGKHFKVEISSKNNRQLWIPPGFAHGFIALEDNTIFSYKCTNYYSKEHEMDLLWNDVDLDIHWGIEDPIVSEKDQKAQEFKNFNSPF